MKVSCWQHHFLLWRSAPARQAGYAEALGGKEELVSFASKNSVRHNTLNSFIGLSNKGWRI
jgi:hypothetical protein